MVVQGRMDTMSVIGLEGHISAGKSTALRNATGDESGSDDDARDIRRSGEDDFLVVLEPTASNPMLPLFYSNPARFGTPMQAWMLQHRFQTYVAALRRAAKEGLVVVLDRCFMTGDRVFVEWNHECGSISDADYAEFAALRAMASAGLPLPQRVVYLDASIETIEERIRRRSRSCECGIPRPYLEGIAKWYGMIEAEHAARGFVWHHEDWSDFGRERDGGGYGVLMGHIRAAPRLDAAAVLAVVGDEAEMARRAALLRGFYETTLKRIGEPVPAEASADWMEAVQVC